MKRFFFLTLFLLALGTAGAHAQFQRPGCNGTGFCSPVGGGGGGAVSVKWNAVSQNNFTALTTMAIGSTAAAGSCGTFTAGDFLITQAYLWTNGGAAPGTISTPTGWTSLGNATPNSDAQYAAFYKIATGSESCSTGFSVSWTNSVSALSWSISDFNSTGSGPTLDVAGTIATGSTLPGYTASSISPTGSTDMLIFLAGTEGSKSPYTLPTGFTSQVNTTTETQEQVATETLTSSGATGSVWGTANGTFGKYAAVLVALKP